MSYPQSKVSSIIALRGRWHVSLRSYYSNMRSSNREEIVEVLDVLEAGYKRALDLMFDVLTTPERLGCWSGGRVFAVNSRPSSTP